MQTRQVLGAVIALLTSVPLASATTFSTTVVFPIWVQDISNHTQEVPAMGSVEIDGGWAFVYAGASALDEGFYCEGFAYIWPSTYATVTWALKVDLLESIGQLTDPSSYPIEQNGVQNCTIASRQIVH